jgi:hypothetical protein
MSMTIGWYIVWETATVSDIHYSRIFSPQFTVCDMILLYIKVITKLPNSEQSYKGKVKTHNYINRQNQSTTGKL